MNITEDIFYKQTDEYRIVCRATGGSTNWVALDIFNKNLNKWIQIGCVAWVKSGTREEAITLAEDYFNRQGEYWQNQTPESYAQMQRSNKADLESYARYGCD